MTTPYIVSSFVSYWWLALFSLEINIQTFMNSAGSHILTEWLNRSYICMFSFTRHIPSKCLYPTYTYYAIVLQSLKKNLQKTIFKKYMLMKRFETGQRILGVKFRLQLFLRKREDDEMENSHILYWIYHISSLGTNLKKSNAHKFLICSAKLWQFWSSQGNLLTVLFVGPFAFSLLIWYSQRLGPRK